MTIIEVLKQALEFIDCYRDETAERLQGTLTNLIEQMEKAEPVAWWYKNKVNSLETITQQPPDRLVNPEAHRIIPLYSHPAPVIPEGWKLVPIDPTEAMLSIGLQSSEYYFHLYKAMLSAAPEYKP